MTNYGRFCQTQAAVKLPSFNVKTNTQRHTITDIQLNSSYLPCRHQAIAAQALVYREFV